MTKWNGRGSCRHRELAGFGRFAVGDVRGGRRRGVFQLPIRLVYKYSSRLGSRCCRFWGTGSMEVRTGLRRVERWIGGLLWSRWSILDRRRVRI